MIYFSLPNFIYNHKIINFFVEIEKTFPQVFKLPVHFTYATGNLPFCYWYGGYNINQSNGPTYDTIIHCTDVSTLPIRFNCSNIYLQKENLDDVLGNLILQHSETGSNAIEISNLEFLNYFIKNYPYYKIILSKYSNLLVPLSPETLNMVLKEVNLDLIGLHEIHTLDLNYLKQLELPEKYEITINSSCVFNCQNYLNCQQELHQSQYLFLKNNNFKQCGMAVPYHQRSPLITLEQIQKDYMPLGFVHYSIADTISDEIDNLLIFLINYFIKPESQAQILELAISKGVL